MMTTEWMAVITELITPKVTPMTETSVPSKKTPTKKPAVTEKHAKKTRRDGREWSTKKEVQTVKGRTMPLATW